MTKSFRLPTIQALVAPIPERHAPWIPGRLRGGTWVTDYGGVDSVQWVDLPGPGNLDLAFLEPLYFAWVPCISVGTVKPRYDDSLLSLGLVPFHWPVAIRMDEPQTTDTARVRSIQGGMLASGGGSIGFHALRRSEGARLVVAVRSLHPRLPLWLYFRIQARLHERSTFAFLRQVRRAWCRRANASHARGVDRIRASQRPRVQAAPRDPGDLA